MCNKLWTSLKSIIFSKFNRLRVIKIKDIFNATACHCPMYLTSTNSPSFTCCSALWHWFVLSCRSLDPCSHDRSDPVFLNIKVPSDSFQFCNQFSFTNLLSMTPEDHRPHLLRGYFTVALCPVSAAFEDSRKCVYLGYTIASSCFVRGWDVGCAACEHI